MNTTTSTGPAHSTTKLGLYLTVFITGAAVMVIELLGTRVIAPFYGASLYVWSSLISVTMIALALGYFAGGHWADRARRTGLSLVISLAAVLTLMIPWATRPVLLATDPLGLRGGAFTAALVLFSPSLIFLGMVGPFAIKRATAQLEGIGTSAGSIYAVSTLGSVIGTLALGFFLFPLLGSREILVGLGLALLALGATVGLFERHWSRHAISAVPSLSLVVIGLSLLPAVVGAGYRDTGTGKFTIRSERESLYGWVRVIDEPARNLRMLTSDASVIGAAAISTGRNALTYQDIVELIPTLNAPVRTALLIGQGAGHMATGLKEKYGIITDTVEIDPAVDDAARHFFGFQPTGRALLGDARYEIRHLTGPYDLVILDCFTGGSEPAHLLTVETLTQLRALLSPRGILALNFVAFADGGHNLALASVARTLEAVFPNQRVFVSEPGDDFSDYIFLASATPVAIDSPILTPSQVDWLRQRLIPVDPRQGQLLSDNLNPLEHLQTRKAEHYRHMIVDWLGTDILVR